MKLKTKAWPDGREWPDELVLDCGSSMPTDVYGIDNPSAFGVQYVRHDIVLMRVNEALEAGAKRQREKEAKCTVGSSKLFPEPQCEAKVTQFLFGDPYCEEHFQKLVHLHSLVCKAENRFPKPSV